MQPPSNWSGFFLALSGIDGSGKSTLRKLLSEHFRSNGIYHFPTSEPTNGKLGIILREYLTDPDSPPALDSLVFAADRIEHCQKDILPRLQEGCMVISDRYRDSSYVYQSIQGKKVEISLDWVKTINKFSLKPDLTILLDLDPEIALARKKKQIQKDGKELEKFENLEFQQKIRTLFLQNANSKQEEHYLILDARLTPQELLNHSIKKIHDLIQKLDKNLVKSQ